jgi:hypothetical protein
MTQFKLSAPAAGKKFETCVTQTEILFSVIRSATFQPPIYEKREKYVGCPGCRVVKRAPVRDRRSSVLQIQAVQAVQAVVAL